MPGRSQPARTQRELAAGRRANRVAARQRCVVADGCGDLGTAGLSWGWRFPFLISALLVVVGLWIRLTIAESPLFREVEQADTKAAAPILEVLRRYPKQVLLAVGARVGVDVAFYTFVLFITTYITTYSSCRAATPSTRC